MSPPRRKKPQIHNDLLDRFHQLTPDELSHQIMEAGPAELELLLHHPRITEKQVALALRNRSISAALLKELGNDRRWIRSYDVKHALVVHPRTPRHLALRYLKFLYLKHLVQAIDDHQVPPGIKRQATDLLAQRMPQVTLGERIAMAKTGGRGVVKLLARDRTLHVLRALIRNPKLTSSDLARILLDPATPPSICSEVTEFNRWRSVYAVRLALVKSPQAPLAFSLGHVSSLLKRDLREITRDDSIRRVVRLSAQRVLDERASSRPPLDPGQTDAPAPRLE